MIDEGLLNNVSDMLKKNNFTIATAESCTGGLIAHILTNVSGSSEYFDRGVVSYSNKAKLEILKVSDRVLSEHGAVSAEVAKDMAEGIRKISNADIGLSTTGIAGPTGGTKDKPVGLVYIAVSISNQTVVKKFQFSGNRLQNKESTCSAALQMLLDHLNSC